MWNDGTGQESGKSWYDDLIYKLPVLNNNKLCYNNIIFLCLNGYIVSKFSTSRTFRWKTIYFEASLCPDFFCLYCGMLKSELLFCCSRIEYPTSSHLDDSHRNWKTIGKPLALWLEKGGARNVERKEPRLQKIQMKKGHGKPDDLAWKTCKQWRSNGNGRSSGFKYKRPAK